MEIKVLEIDSLILPVIQLYSVYNSSVFAEQSWSLEQLFCYWFLVRFMRCILEENGESIRMYLKIQLKELCWNCYMENCGLQGTFNTLCQKLYFSNKIHFWWKIVIFHNFEFSRQIQLWNILNPFSRQIIWILVPPIMKIFQFSRLKCQYFPINIGNSSILAWKFIFLLFLQRQKIWKKSLKIQILIDFLR